MNSLIVFSRKIVALALFSMSVIVVAQSNYKESFKVGDDIVISVNTSHTDVVFETWNKDKVEVEAYIEGEDLSKEEKRKIFENWNLDVLGNSKKVVITSNKGSLWSGVESMPSLEGLEGLEDLEINLEGLEGLEGLNIL
ncbi:MAG: hypothetical protein KUG68_07960 [Flavobacteriaceae bacterium]|nr:hypothetical protein [Flavobacteriaceae bacterium]